MIYDRFEGFYPNSEKLRAMANDSAKSLEIGKAAEHLVCADIILSGYRCFLSDQGLPYDLCADTEIGIVRIQVKATCFPKNLNATGRNQRLGYSFHVRRRGKFGKGERLDRERCDLVALVALDIAAIRYEPVEQVAQTAQFLSPNSQHSGSGKGKASLNEFERNWFNDALARLAK